MLKEYNEQLQKLRAQAVEALEEIRSNSDEAREAELEQRHAAIMVEWDKVEAKANREREHQERMQRFEERSEAQRNQRRPGARHEQSGVDDPEAGEITYRSAFNAYLGAAGQEWLLSPEQRSVLRQGYETVETRAQTTTTTEGGYTVPTELLPRLIEAMAAFGPMLDPTWATEFVTSTGVTMTMPTIDDTANGSMVAQHSQGTTLTDDGGADAVFGQKSLEAYGYNTEWIRVSKELADDSALAMESILIRILAKRLARKANTLLTTGDGTGDPNGLITAASTGKTAASATAIIFDELMDLEHSVDEAYRSSPSAGYMFKDSTLLALRKLKDGNGQYIWQAGNVQAGVPNTLNGYRYKVNPDMAAIATTNKTVAFGDMAAYFVRKVGSPLIAAIQDKDFWPGFGIAGYWRIDGELSDTAAIKLLVQA